jgi:hypothetical protein
MASKEICGYLEKSATNQRRESVSRCPEAFNAFVETISLTKTQQQRITSAVDGLIGHLTYHLPMLKRERPFLQGSFPNGTAIKPVSGGEYDVDLVVRTGSSTDSPDDALNDLEAAVRKHGRYTDRIVRKKPCVRLEYASEGDIGFHVDIVPVRHGKNTAPLDAPRRGDGWHETAPREFTEWCRIQGDYFSRTVRILKRWRDEQQDVRSAVKSIILQVLVAQAMPRNIADDAERLAVTLENLKVLVQSESGVPIVKNPVLNSENLARRWSLADFNQFRQHIVSASEAAQSALAEVDQTESQLKWADLLGDGFPTPDSSAAAIVLADQSHKAPISSAGWTERIDRRYHIDLTAKVTSENRRRVVFDSYPSNGPLIMAGWKIRYKANVKAPANAAYSIWWQVVNTGMHARNKSALRGEFLQGRDLAKNPSSDPTVTWESTEYTGRHYIEAFIIENSVVVARSGPFYINVRNNKWKLFKL